MSIKIILLTFLLGSEFVPQCSGRGGYQVSHYRRQQQHATMYQTVTQPARHREKRDSEWLPFKFQNSNQPLKPLEVSRKQIPTYTRRSLPSYSQTGISNVKRGVIIRNRNAVNSQKELADGMKTVPSLPESFENPRYVRKKSIPSLNQVESSPQQSRGRIFEDSKSNNLFGKSNRRNVIEGSLNSGILASSLITPSLSQVEVSVGFKPISSQIENSVTKSKLLEKDPNSLEDVPGHQKEARVSPTQLSVKDSGLEQEVSFDDEYLREALLMVRTMGRNNQKVLKTHPRYIVDRYSRSQKRDVLMMDQANVPTSRKVRSPVSSKFFNNAVMIGFFIVFDVVLFLALILMLVYMFHGWKKKDKESSSDQQKTSKGFRRDKTLKADQEIVSNLKNVVASSDLTHEDEVLCYDNFDALKDSTVRSGIDKIDDMMSDKAWHHSFYTHPSHQDSQLHTPSTSSVILDEDENNIENESIRYTKSLTSHIELRADKLPKQQ